MVSWATPNTELPPRYTLPPMNWRALRHPVFRALWIASVASNLGTWLQGVGAAWLMTSLAASTTMVALVQAVNSLPMFLLSLLRGGWMDAEVTSIYSAGPDSAFQSATPEPS